MTHRSRVVDAPAPAVPTETPPRRVPAQSYRRAVRKPRSSLRGKRRIALFVADPLRDLHGVLLTAFELCQMGAICYVLPQRNGFGDIYALAPDFVMLPAFRPYYAARARNYLDANIQYGLLDTEQVVYSSLGEYGATFWREQPLTDQARCLCAWGPGIADYWVDERMARADQVHVTGCPRFDYYHPSLAPVCQTAYPSPALSGKHLLLLNTNFTTGNAATMSLEHMIAQFHQNYGFSRAQVLEWYEVERRAVSEMMELGKRLAGDFPDAAVVIRPHPQENASTYEEMRGGIPNLAVLRQGPVMQWIMNADAVIQRSCTTAVEATLAGVPALSPLWIPYSHWYPLPEQVSIQCSDYNETRAIVESVLSGTFSAPEQVRADVLEAQRLWFDRIDGLAHKRVARVIMESMTESVEPDEAECRRMAYGLHHGGGAAGLANRVRYLVRQSPQFSMRQLKVIPPEPLEEPLSIDSVRGLVKLLSQAKATESPRPVEVTKAEDAGAFICNGYLGRTLMLEAV